jgi:hypothetical protein
MISADPTVPDALNAQAWNCYSYVGNDPLTFTDPNGYSWLSEAFHAVRTFFRSLLANPIVRAIAQIVLTAALGPVVGIIAAAAAGAAIITGLTGGNLGQMLRAGAIAGVTAFAFYVVGGATNAVAGYDPAGQHITPQFGTPASAFNVAGHAGVGCLSAVASGASCQSGALSGAAGAAAGPFVPTNDYVSGLVGHSVVGGLASVAGGGKFENGAITAAFGYMYNRCGDDPGACGPLTAANAIVNGAYSIFPGTGYALRYLGRSVGLYGANEQLRSDQEANAIHSGVAATKDFLASGPAAQESARIAIGSAAGRYLDDELNVYHSIGRIGIGAVTGLGPAAAAGDALHAIEKGHNAIDAEKAMIRGSSNNGP